MLELISPDLSPSEESSGARAVLNENLGGFGAQRHGLADAAETSEDWVLEDGIPVGDLRNRVFVGNDLALRIAHRDAATVRRQHHHAFHHGLSADEGFLTAFEDGQHLQMVGKAQKTSEGHKGSPALL